MENNLNWIEQNVFSFLPKWQRADGSRYRTQTELAEFNSPSSAIIINEAMNVPLHYPIENLIWTNKYFVSYHTEPHQPSKSKKNVKNRNPFRVESVVR